VLVSVVLIYITPLLWSVSVLWSVSDQENLWLIKEKVFLNDLL